MVRQHDGYVAILEMWSHTGAESHLKVATFLKQAHRWFGSAIFITVYLTLVEAPFF